jgi:hypothetical protein
MGANLAAQQKQVRIYDADLARLGSLTANFTRIAI